jgi:hypothetical protein
MWTLVGLWGVGVGLFVLFCELQVDGFAIVFTKALRLYLRFFARVFGGNMTLRFHVSITGYLQCFRERFEAYGCSQKPTSRL